MSFIESIQNRYSTKMYDASKKLDSAQIEQLQEILRLSPSSINSQPWKFTFITKEDVKTALAKASKHNEDKVRNCDTVIVFSCMNNIELFESTLLETHPQRAIDYYNANIKHKTNAEKFEWMSRQVYLALGVLLSACAEMNIDSTAMEGIELDTYDSILNIENYSTLFAVAIGTRDTEDFNQLHKAPKTRKAKDLVIRVIED